MSLIVLGLSAMSHVPQNWVERSGDGCGADLEPDALVAKRPASACPSQRGVCVKWSLSVRETELLSPVRAVREHERGDPVCGVEGCCVLIVKR